MTSTLLDIKRVKFNHVFNHSSCRRLLSWSLTRSNQDFTAVIAKVNLLDSGTRTFTNENFNPGNSKLRNDGILIQIHHDKMNLARALVTAKALVDQDPLWHHMRVDFKMQKDRAIKLHEAAQISYRRRCCYLDLYKFQDYLKDYQIIVAHMDQLEWENLNPEGTYQLMLLCDGEHYDVITSLPEVITVMKAEEKQRFK